MSPLLYGPAVDRARAAIDDIASALRDPSVYDVDPGFRSASIGRGQAGAAVFFAELAAATGDESAGETALAFLDNTLELAGDDPPSALLYPGTIGVGWTLAYLEGRLIDPDPDENDVDALAAQALSVPTWPSPDLIRGVAGVGVYVLERGRPMDATVERLAQMATETPQGTTWYVDPKICLPERREMYPDGYYDVGIAHGQAGVMVVLAHALAAGTEAARPLLASSTEWLLAQRLPEDGRQGRYPAIVPNDDRDPGGSRAAWCYGDPGVAIGLLAAGRALGDDAVVEEARQVALASAARSEPGEAGILDAPLCHGSFGLMHVFSRLYEGLGDELLADTARHWFDYGMTQRRDGEPVAGWGSARPEDGKYRYEPLAGFLEGATGVGLALLAATTDTAPDWDALLLTKPVPA